MAHELPSPGNGRALEAPELTFVLPALNEASTIEACLDWCMEGLRDAGITGEVLIVDSSSDATAQLALAKGARVLRTERPGLGQAYIESLPFIRGRFVVMGDCDCTYDFRALAPFVEAFRQGAEFVMGSRFKGSIEPGAMPAHHRYFGTPLTTWILNRMFRSRFSDIHCGMRGITLAALKRMRITSSSWEYASEMVVKSVHMGLVTAEVPVHFYKDREGRLSHHRRTGWWSPWAAGWINLKAMFTYGADFFLIKPGLLLLGTGLLLTLPLAAGPVTAGPITFSIFWMLLGITLTVLGLQSLFIGLLGRIFFDYRRKRIHRWGRIFQYTRMTLVSMALFLTGFVLDAAFMKLYVSRGFMLSMALERRVIHGALFGLFLMVLGFMLFAFTLILNAYLLSQRSRVHDPEEVL